MHNAQGILQREEARLIAEWRDLRDGSELCIDPANHNYLTRTGDSWKIENRRSGLQQPSLITSGTLIEVAEDWTSVIMAG
jgi:hypothetical protein